MQRTFSWTDPNLVAAAARGADGLTFLKSIAGRGRPQAAPSAECPGFELIEVEAGRTIFEVTASEFHYKPDRHRARRPGGDTLRFGHRRGGAFDARARAGLHLDRSAGAVSEGDHEGRFRCEGKVVHRGARVALVHDHRSRLCRLARKEGLSGEDALDCVQEAFHAFLRLPSARVLVDAPEDSLKLLTVLTRNQARNRRKKHGRKRPHVEVPLEMANEVQRRGVTLRLLDEVPGEDVTRLLGLEAGHVAVLLHRAKETLQRCVS